MKRRLLFSSILLVALSSLASATVVLAIDPPGGSVAGQPGDTIGWGFTTQSDPNLWVTFVTSFLLVESNPFLGTYTDFIGSEGGPVNFELAPGSSNWTQAFDSIAGTGIGSYAIDPAALPGAVDSGTLRVLYETFSADPNTCGACDAGSGFVDVPFQLAVTATPEPATWLLLVAGIAAIAGCTRFDSIRNKIRTKI